MIFLRARVDDWSQKLSDTAPIGERSGSFVVISWAIISPIPFLLQAGAQAKDCRTNPAALALVVFQSLFRRSWGQTKYSQEHAAWNLVLIGLSRSRLNCGAINCRKFTRVQDHIDDASAF